MEIKVLESQNSIFNQFMYELREIDIQKDSMRFRYNMQRIGSIMAYEISKTLPYENRNTQTSLGTKDVPVLSTQPVLATILRAGLPLHQGMLDFFDKAENAFISAYRAYENDGSFSIEFNHISTPDLSNKVVILSDPMLATGASMLLSYNALLKNGEPNHVHIATIIASKEGVEYLKGHMKKTNVTLWIGTVDDELTSKSYIVPGLGDAGDLAFGSKNK
ncbi:MAG: uracil phosphoribosyltransferase [Salinivirgaceae bacterium]|nr:uracil phosphoribosyltransferase [Salinivirgaceae bacterium]